MYQKIISVIVAAAFSLLLAVPVAADPGLDTVGINDCVLDYGVSDYGVMTLAAEDETSSTVISPLNMLGDAGRYSFTTSNSGYAYNTYNQISFDALYDTSEDLYYYIDYQDTFNDDSDYLTTLSSLWWQLPSNLSLLYANADNVSRFPEAPLNTDGFDPINSAFAYADISSSTSPFLYNNKLYMNPFLIKFSNIHSSFTITIPGQSKLDLSTLFVDYGMGLASTDAALHFGTSSADCVPTFRVIVNDSAGNNLFDKIWSDNSSSRALYDARNYIIDGYGAGFSGETAANSTYCDFFNFAVVDGSTYLSGDFIVNDSTADATYTVLVSLELYDTDGNTGIWYFYTGLTEYMVPGMLYSDSLTKLRINNSHDYSWDYDSESVLREYFTDLTSTVGSNTVYLNDMDTMLAVHVYGITEGVSESVSLDVIYDKLIEIAGIENSILNYISAQNFEVFTYKDGDQTSSVVTGLGDLVAAYGKNLDNNTGRLSQVFASDDDIALKESSSDNTSAFTDSFTGEGSGAVSSDQITQMGEISESAQGLLETEAIPGDFFSAIDLSGEAWIWFSEEVANELEPGTTARSVGLPIVTDYSSKYKEEVEAILGG